MNLAEQWRKYSHSWRRQRELCLPDKGHVSKHRNTQWQTLTPSSGSSSLKKLNQILNMHKTSRGEISFPKRMFWFCFHYNLICLFRSFSTELVTSEQRGGWGSVPPSAPSWPVVKQSTPNNPTSSGQNQCNLKQPVPPLSLQEWVWSLKQLQGEHIAYEISDNWLTPISFNFPDRSSSVTLRWEKSEIKTLFQSIGLLSFYDHSHVSHLSFHFFPQMLLSSEMLSLFWYR